MSSALPRSPCGACAVAGRDRCTTSAQHQWKGGLRPQGIIGPRQRTGTALRREEIRSEETRAVRVALTKGGSATQLRRKWLVVPPPSQRQPLKYKAAAEPREDIYSRGHFFVGVPRIGLGLQDPQPRVLPLYYTPFFYFFLDLERVLIHLTQALVLSPEGKSTHWRLGYFLFLSAGLYLPRSLLRGVKSIEPLPQISHNLAIYFVLGF